MKCVVASMMTEGLDDPCGGIQTGMQSDRRGYKMCCKQHHYVVGGITLDKIAPGKMQREFTTRWVKKILFGKVEKTCCNSHMPRITPGAYRVECRIEKHSFLKTKQTVRLAQKHPLNFGSLNCP